ncbi:MAG: hypothetical protein ACK41T_03525 [Pseudobdellovibrio sp.]
MKSIVAVFMSLVVCYGELSQAQQCRNLFVSQNYAQLSDLLPGYIDKAILRKNNAYVESKIDFIQDYLIEHHSQYDKAQMATAMLQTTIVGKNDFDSQVLKKAIFDHFDRKRNHKDWSLSNDLEFLIHESLQDVISRNINEYKNFEITVEQMTKTLNEIAYKGKFTISELDSLWHSSRALAQKSKSIGLSLKIEREILKKTDEYSHTKNQLQKMVQSLDLARSRLKESDLKHFEDIYEAIADVYMLYYVAL